MATTTDPRATGTDDALRMIPLDAIDVVEEFNPRDARDAEDFAPLVATVREYGVLQPVLVAPAEDGRFWLIAGEGRYRAAIEAGDKEIPVRVRPVDDETGGVELALIENLVRERLDPVAEARGYQALIDRGLNVRGIARRLPKVPQKRISERLAILKLPGELQAQIAEGAIPLQAVKALTALAKIHRELPAVAARKVLAGPREQWDEPTTWADLAADPITVVSADYEDEVGQLPADVLESGCSYPIERFSLTEDATRDLAELAQLLGIESQAFAVRFDNDLVEQALALKAAYKSKDGWHALIVGRDVADQLVHCRVPEDPAGQREGLTRAQRARGGGGRHR